MSDLFGAPPAPAPAPPPARRARAPRAKAAPAPAAPAQVSRPATELQVMQVMQVAQDEPPAAAPPAPPAPRGRLVTLHDGRQVDSWSMDWVRECLASTLLQLSNSDRSEWFAGYAEIHGEPAEQDLRRLVRAVAAAREGDAPRRR